MKPSLALLAISFILVAMTMISQTRSAPAGIGPRFKGPLGLQLYSLRSQFSNDVPGTLAKVQALGFTNVELAGTYGLTPEQFKAQLDAHSLKAIAAHYSYDLFRTNVEGIIRDAKIFGFQYAGCAWIPHNGDVFDEKNCRDAIAVFNRAGESLAKAGVKFNYHTHGYEFQPYKDGTLLDLLMSETNPKFVCYEMDVFWVVHGGQDPVKLFEKYGNRFELLHLKGMRDSTPTGLLTGRSDVTNDVPIGLGKIDFPPLLRAAEKAGAKWYFIEDESPLVEQQLPQSLRYLESIK